MRPRLRTSRFPVWLLALGIVLGARAQSFHLEFARPSLDRWMYPYNATPGTRPSAPVFGTLGDASGVDSRHGQFLLGFDTFSQVATNRGPANYLIRRARVTATINRDLAFRYDGTQDAYTSYVETNGPDYTPDGDAGRPVELFGAGFRNHFDAATFFENSPFGGAATGGRNAFAAGYNSGGVLVDVSNNTGKTNAAFPSFEVYPFAVGQITHVASGELVPTGTTMVFDLNLNDPLVRHYLQTGLNTGRLRFALASLHVSEFGGQPNWPDFYTRDNLLGAAPTFELEGAVIDGVDTDADGLADEWERFYFGGLQAAPGDDPDQDGQSNLAEQQAGAVPTDGASSLRISAVKQSAAAGVLVQFQHAASRQYVIDYSSDLRSWTRVEHPALTYYNTALGSVTWRDEDASNHPARFYRVLAR